jgi:hypothetical protein
MEDYTVCQCCSEKYNHNEKLPIMLVPCGDTICKQCYLKFDQPQEHKTKCPICEEAIEFDPNRILPNKMFLKFI